MADSSSTRFRCLGLVEAFIPGKKTPYKKVVLKEVQFESAAGELMSEAEIKLDKSIRKKAGKDLKPGDWVSISGKRKASSQSGDFKWKASKASKLSTRQAKKQQTNFDQRAIASSLASVAADLEAQATAKQSIKDVKNQAEKVSALKPVAAAKLKPPKVLICQKSSCRKKGSMKVSAAIEAELKQAGRWQDVQIKSTGCMSSCKAGPNMVILPDKKRYKKVTPKQARSLIKAVL